MCATAVLIICIVLSTSCTTFGADPSVPEVDRAAADAVKEAITDLLVDVELRGTYGVLCTGQIVMDRPLEQPHFNGVFPFTSFRAVKANDVGDVLKHRFWCVKAAVVNGIYKPHGMSYDEIFDGETRWFSTAGGAIRKQDPKQDFFPHQYAYPKIDPFISVFAYPAGLISARSADLEHLPFLRLNEFLSATAGLKESRATSVIAPNHYGHFFIAEAHGWRPTKFAVTEGNKKLEDDDKNAEVVNYMRWKEIGNGKWFPEAGWHSQYTTGTKEKNRGGVHVSYQVLWIPEDDVKQQWFERSDVDSTPGTRLSQVEDGLKRLEKVAPYEVRRGNP